MDPMSMMMMVSPCASLNPTPGPSHQIMHPVVSPHLEILHRSMNQSSGGSCCHPNTVLAGTSNKPPLLEQQLTAIFRAGWAEWAEWAVWEWA